MKPEEARALALAVLQGKNILPRPPPHRRALAKALPLTAEALRCTEGADLESARQGLTGLWLALSPDQLQQEEFGTPQLGAGCQEAAELLGIRLHPKQVPSRHPQFPPRDIDLASFRRKLSRPRVLVPLANEAPARVFHTTSPGPTSQDERLRDTARLVERFLGVGAPRWALEHSASGRSMMAALFVRALLEQWPEAAVRLVPGWSEWDDFPAIGFTGELDAEGLAVPVGDLEEKIRRFFSCYPEGRLFVPDTQWKQARLIFEKLRLPKKEPYRHHTPRREEFLQPFRGALDLLVRLGITTPHCQETQLFEKLRQAALKVPCWNGAVLDVSQTLDLGLEWVAPGGNGAPESSILNEAGLLAEVHQGWHSGRAHPACIEGGPGSGKSIVMRRLCAHLLKENPLLGPALRVEARRLVQTGFSISQALHDSWLPILGVSTCNQLVELAHAPCLHGGVWLLVDGLDEVQSEDRRKIRELVARWPGPSIIGARPLPNEVPGAPHVRVASLSEAQQQRLFALENKPGHWALVAEQFHEYAPRRPSDRRKEMLADLCSTPLGVSLLAMRPEAELGERLDVPTVLRRSIGTLLERAENSERISKQIRWRVVHQGLGILGAAAWSMIRRGESVLTYEDLTKMEGPSEVVDAVYHVLDNSDLVQRVGPELYQFSHKSLAELCAAIHLHQRPEAEAELLSRVGEPGAEAVASHFAAQLQEPGRLTAFIRQLAANPRRPLSSLALATHLLVANGPGRLDTEAALEVLVRRVRLASHDFDHHWPSLPGGLDDDSEMWLALGRWAQALRPHADMLVASCPVSTRDFLRGEPPPPLKPPYTVGRRLSPSMDFAERLALTLGMEVPLEVLTRMEAGPSVLISRPIGPWLMELEALMDAGDEVYPGSEPIAASVWAQRAPEKRLLERLDVLSRHAPTTLAPLLAVVVKNGRPEQKREALLRAALNSLKLGERDNEGDWIVKASFAGKTAALSSEQWLRQWEQLWGCGLVGEVSSRSQCLDPLYAEFIEDPCGPARWRALVALHHLKSPTCPERFRAALHDGFRPVRIQALALLAAGGHTFPAEAWASLISQDEHERWVAFEATGLVKTAPLELLLAVLAHERTPSPEEPSSPPRWLPTETPWEEAIRHLGENAHRKLIGEVQNRLEEYGYRAFANLMDGPHGEVVEEIFPSWYATPPASFFLELLETGSPRQRRFAARRLHSQRHAETLAPYMEDADPEVAHRARQALQEQRKEQRWQAEYKARDKAERRPSENYWKRPVLELAALENLDSFEGLWKALSKHRMPHTIETQLAYHQEEEARRASLEDNEFEGRIESVSDRERKPFLQRLRQLYRPHHQSLLLTGLTNEELVPFAVTLLREHLPVPDILALISRGGRLLERAVEVLRGTPHAPEAARRLREEALADKLRPEPDPYQTMHESSIASGYAAKEVRRWVISQLEQLDGVAALLPWLEPGTPEAFRLQTIEYLHGFIYSRWRQREALNRPGELDWARRATEEAEEEEVREIAYWILSVLGDAEDGARCRPLLDDHNRPPRTLGIMLRLYRRFASKSELPFFRTFLTHSPEAGSEAAAALVHLGGDSVLEELVQLLESPPPTLDSDRHFIHHSVGWKRMAAEAIIRFGNGAQAKRLARLMARDREVWRVAARHIRLPEHLLFIAGHLGNKDPGAEDDDGYDDARKVFEEMLQRVDAASARRVMLEAMPWDYTFERSFEGFVSTHPEDTDLILSALRERPDSPLALGWLGSLAEAEELLDALWREQDVPWW